MRNVANTKSFEPFAILVVFALSLFLANLFRNLRLPLNPNFYRERFCALDKFAQSVFRLCDDKCTYKLRGTAGDFRIYSYAF